MEDMDNVRHALHPRHVGVKYGPWLLPKFISDWSRTSGIVDVIMNSMAMTFILNLDELIFSVRREDHIAASMHASLRV